MTFKKCSMALTIIGVTAALFITTGVSAWSAGQATPAGDRSDNREKGWTYKFTETVQVKVIGGVPRPQFAMTDNPPSLTSVGDGLAFSADLSGVDRRGEPVTGTMHGSCIATGVEERTVPACVRRNPDGSCARTDPLSPLFLCHQVLRLNDPERGIDGISQLTIHGFVRQLDAAGDPPGQGQKSQWLAITGGTGRFEGASGQIKYDLRENPSPPPIKDLEVFISHRNSRAE